MTPEPLACAAAVHQHAPRNYLQVERGNVAARRRYESACFTRWASDLHQFPCGGILGRGPRYAAESGELMRHILKVMPEADTATEPS